jgi:hypothetical protein
VIPGGRTFAVAGTAAAVLWLQAPALTGTAPKRDESRSERAAPKCERTLSPHGRLTLQRAVHLKRRIRVLCLHGGVYRVRELWLRRHNVTITSVPGERATVQGRIIVRARGITLSGLTLDGTRPGRRHSLPNPTINGARFTLRASDVTNRNGICVHPLTYKGITPKRFLIERNRIHHCGRRPRTNHDHGIYVAGGTGVIRRNAIFDNADRGVQLYPRARGVRVYENTIDGNGEGVLFGDEAARNVVTRNLITNSRQRWNVEIYDLRGRGNAVRSNCVQASRREYGQRGGIAPEIEAYLRLERNVAAGVEYVDRARGDLRASTTSPACAGVGAPDDVTAGSGG